MAEKLAEFSGASFNETAVVTIERKVAKKQAEKERERKRESSVESSGAEKTRRDEATRKKARKRFIFCGDTIAT